MEVVHYIFIALLIMLHVAVMLHIVYTKHESSDEATMWLMVVTVLPGVGILLYLFFGITNLHGISNRLREISTAEQLRGHGIPAAEKQWRKLPEFMPPPEVMAMPVNATLDRLFPTRPALSGNKVELLCDGVQAYPRMLADIKKAKSSIRLESFIINSDKAGTTFLEALIKKADEGVDVKVLFDSFGSFFSIFSHLFRRLMHRRHPHFAMLGFSPVNLLTPWKFQLRNHRKLLIVDGKVAYCGGINIADENRRYPKVPRAKYIHDLHCRIEGPAAAIAVRSFLRDWAYTRRRHRDAAVAVDGDYPQLEHDGNNIIRLIDSGPGENYCGSERMFFAAAALAQKSLYIITPYFVPGNAFAQALIMAAARGVDVRVIVPAKNNHKFVDWASRSFYATLLAGGVRIFVRHGFFSHTKALLVDNAWGFMGSSNCDTRSFRLNFELDFCFEGGDFLPQITCQFAAEFGESTELEFADELKKHPLLTFRDDLFALLAPIL